MPKIHIPASKTAEDFESEDFPTIDGELLEISDDEEITKVPGSKLKIQNSKFKIQDSKTENQSPKTKNRYVFLPFIFLNVALLGGLRLNAGTNDFLFLKPALICLIFAATLLILFFRARLITIEGWISEDFPALRNAANACVLISLFAASVQIFNSLLPERGLPFWIVGFCFLWTLWNNLFAEFEIKKLIKSLGAMFAFAFVVKYLILANLTAAPSENWLAGLWKNPTQEAFTWALDLPRFSAGTGYIQFFAVAFYLIGLFLMPQKTSIRE